MQKRWFIKERPATEIISTLVTELKISSLMATILVQRGLTTEKEIRSFFKSDLEKLHDPFLMLGMKEAAECLEKHVSAQHKILIYGDYDVDGTTAVALVHQILAPHTQVFYYIPDRHQEGYGLSYKGIEFAQQHDCQLILTLDCGVREVEKIAHARQLGMDVIVCDHHNPGEQLPECIVLDPKQADCPYPFKELCGCGVGFKLMQAWLMLRKESTDYLFKHLDFVAIAIGADIVSVMGENRVLCSLGIDQINRKERKGINALIESTTRKFPLKLSDVVFTIAPRINAAGRLNSGMRAVELLLADDMQKATEIAEEINAYNAERRELDQEITAQAWLQITEDEHYASRKSTVVFNSEWHKGVVGIVASRLIEKSYRPTIVLTESNGVATGSARSVASFNIYNAIESCTELLTQFGGHHHAAGLSLPLENIEAFKIQFDTYVQQHIKPIDEYEELVIDLEIKLHELFLAGESQFQVPRLYNMIKELEPFGPCNDKPVFCARNVYAENQQVLKDFHLRFALIDPSSGVKLQAIGFNMAEKFNLIASGCAFDCAFTLETNTWNDKTTLQVQIRDIQEPGLM